MSDYIEKTPHEELKSQRPSEDALKEMTRFPMVAVLENIRSLYNVGSMFRTSDGALVEKMFLSGYTGYPPRKEIDKTALGSVDSVPWEHAENTVGLLLDLKRKGYQIVALEHTDASENYTACEYSFPLCLVVGNEVEGVTDETLAVCDKAIEIPMYGLKQSLNVSVAYGIVTYHIIQEWLRKRKK